MKVAPPTFFCKDNSITTQQEVEELPYVKRIQKTQNSIVINLGIPNCSKKIRKVRELGSELLVLGKQNFFFGGGNSEEIYLYPGLVCAIEKMNRYVNGLKS
jgi:hypothetical protein